MCRSPYSEAFTLHLYRTDHERLLEDWGDYRVTSAQHPVSKLWASGVPTDDLKALHSLAIHAVGRPNLALVWHSYVSGARLNDVFVLHSSGSMQLAPRRNGDLREAVLSIYAECRWVAFCICGE